MKARGVRLHAANDLRLEEFELPEITDDEILVKVVSDSICMSTYKCAILGTDHSVYMRMSQSIRQSWDMSLRVTLFRLARTIRTSLSRA